MKSQKGFIEVIVGLVIVALFIGAIWFLTCIRGEFSEQSVSGVVYNTSNNAVVSGNTHFSIRAAVDTLVTEENQSSYCLPPHSPYIKLINEASKDKSIKVVVTTTKIFKVVPAPWICVDNVKVERAN